MRLLRLGLFSDPLAPALRGTVCYRSHQSGVSSVGKLRRVKGHTLFETSIASLAKPVRLFDLEEVLGEEGWIKVLKLDEYAPRQPRRHDELQQVLFPYTEAI